MAALRSRCGHYIFVLFLSFFLSSFFPRLISAVADWMSTTLPHMVWPYCEFRLQVSNVYCMRPAKNTGLKKRQKSPSRHHRTTLSGNIFATKVHVDNRKKMLIAISPPHVLTIWPTSGWDRFGCLGHSTNFNGFRVLPALLHGTLVVGVSQTLRRWTEGATYIRQGGHYVGIGSYSSYFPLSCPEG